MQWPYQVGSYSPDEVQAFCVRNHKWQEFRTSLKGLPTTSKLIMLQRWFLHPPAEIPRRAVNVQVDNYINALKRGGQLDMNLHVQR